MASLASTILNNPEDTAKVRMWLWSKFSAILLPWDMLRVRDLKCSWPNNLERSIRPFKLGLSESEKTQSGTQSCTCSLTHCQCLWHFQPHLL